MENKQITNGISPKKQVAPIHHTGAVLAYIGDAVYELEVRKLLIAKGYYRGNRLHKEAIRRVNAPMQSRLITEMLDSLTDEEYEVFKRGRNTKPKYIPKQANVTEYTNSSGFEAVVGYCYLMGDQERIQEIMNRLEELIEEGERKPQ